MNHNVTALFRQDTLNHDERQGPSKSNPGGGLSTKKRQLSKALPQIQFVNEADKMGAISIVDVLYFSGGKTAEERDRRIETYCNHEGMKILWTADFEILRWLPEHRDKIFDSTDVIAANSCYMRQLLSGYFEDSKIALLTDPVDTNISEGVKKRKKEIYACSQVMLEKGIDEVISLYRILGIGNHSERELNKVFIGSSETWGIPMKDTDSFQLELQLEEVCDNFHWSLPPLKVHEIARRAWILVSFARFESFGYSVAEAMLGGCHIFAIRHGAYLKRIEAGVITPIDNAIDARHKIKPFITDQEPIRNEAAIEYVHENYALPVFREQFRQIVGGLYGI